MLLPLLAFAGVALAQTLPENFGKAPPIGDTPRSTGGRIVVNRYGPYNLAAGGRIETNPTMQHPCPLLGCYITALESDLEYEDGTNANVDTGAWLHHMVVIVQTGTKDVVCPSRTRRVFAVGNERTTTRMDLNGKYGVAIGGFDTLRINLELMNESDTPKVMYMTIRMEITQDLSYKPAHLVWLDACGCCNSEVPAQNGVYKLTTPTWKSTISGNIATAGGHAHDGAERVEIFKNNELICNSEMLYAMTPEYIGAPTGHHSGEEPTKSISNSGLCFNLGRVEVGDSLYAVTHYNATKYPQMVHDGTLHPVMGIANLWVGAD